MKAFRIVFLLILSIGFFSVKSCDKEVTEEFIGNWEAELSEITVRTKDSNGDWKFTRDSVAAGLEIFSDNTASGYIGFATFQDAKVKKNSGNSDVTGVAYTVECGDIGKIFPDDPLDLKEVEIWLSPLKDEMMEGGVRYTEGLAHFPMGDLPFYRTD